MHTEHLQSVRPGLVLLSWFLAVSVASLIVLFTVATNLFDVNSTSGTRIAIASIALGFFAGGLFAGLRAGEAPILYGTAIGLLSLLVWALINVASALAFPSFGWSALTPQLTASVMLLQIATAIVGARAGYRVRLGKTSV